MKYLVVGLPTVPPSANNMYINNPKTKGRFITKEARAWKESAELIIRNAVQEQEWEIEPKTPINVTVTFVHPYIYRFDVAGKEKALIDSLANAIAVDDRYIMNLTLTKRRGEEQVVLIVGASPTTNG